MRARVEKRSVLGWNKSDAHEPEPLPSYGIGINISPHIIRALVLDLVIPHGNLISDKEKPVLGMLAIFPALVLPFFASIMVNLLY